MIGFDHIFYSKYTAFADIYVLPLLIDPVWCLPCAECCGGPGHSENCLYNRPAYKRTFHFRERKNENVILLLSAGQVGSVKFRTPGRHHTEIKAQGTQEGIFDTQSHCKPHRVTTSHTESPQVRTSHLESATATASQG